MVTEHDNFEELSDRDDPGRDDAGHDDRQLEQLLESALSVPPPKPGFVQSLEQRLDEEFAKPSAAQSVDLPLNGALSASAGTNGAVRLATETWESQSSLGESPSTDEEFTADTQADTLSKKSRSSKLVKWAMTLSAAAAVLVAGSYITSRPAYGWAAMLQALQECDWVQTVVSGGAEPSNGWVSSSRGVWAVQSSGRTAFHDLQSQQFSTYESDYSVVLRREVEDGSRWEWETLLIGILAEELDLPEPAQLESLMSAQVVAESWRTIPADNEHGQLVELQVTLKLAGIDRQLDLAFLIDPETELPLQCRVIASDQAKPVLYDFSYPEEGPESIFSMGVPAGTAVVASLASLDRGPKSDQTVESMASLKHLAPPGVTENTEIIDHLVETKKPNAKDEQDEIAAELLNEQVVGDQGDETLIASLPVDSLPASVELDPALPFDELVGRVNEVMADFWESQSVHPANQASDDEFLRRAYLDLTGRIPMVSEVYAFLENESPRRREELVDELLHRRDHATHLAAVWRDMLLPEGMDMTALGGTSTFDEWLAQRFADNVPYDQLAGELLMAEGRVSESGPILFYAALKLNPEEIAGKTARVFLGTRMECAQCHDHFFDEISQEEFWGLAAFFAQISRPLGKLEMASPVLRVHDIHSGEVMLPDTDEVIKPRLPGTNFDLAEPADDSSRREQLVEWLTASGNQRFARATVNRVWEHLFGRGLVNPVDDMRPDNPPISPELLDLLSRDFAASGFDLRRLFRAIVLTDAYQLSSRAEMDDPAQALNFARMNMKTFTAAQLYDCIAVATQHRAMISQEEGGGALERISNTTRQGFIKQFRAPPGERTNYEAGIPQALALMNGQMIHGATNLSTSGLLGSLQAPFFSDEQRLETLFLATLSRLPNDQERDEMLTYLAAVDESGRNEALGDILWALINSAEFTFIH